MKLRKFVFYESYSGNGYDLPRIVYAETESVARQLLIEDNKNPNDYYFYEVLIKENDVPVKGVWIDLCGEYVDIYPIV